jgi:signal transduction histidine kinase
MPNTPVITLLEPVAPVHESRIAEPMGFFKLRVRGFESVFLCLFYFLFTSVIATSVQAEIPAESNEHLLEISDFQGKLPLGKYTYIADIPIAHLEEWFASPENYSRDVFKDSLDSESISGFLDSPRLELHWQKNAGDKLLLNSPSRLSWLAVEIAHTGSEEKDFLLEMVGVQGMSWHYRDQQGNLVSYFDDFSKPQASRLIFDAKPIIPLRLKPNHNYRLLIAAYTLSDQKFADFNLWNPEEFRAQRVRQYLVDGTYFGLVIALMVYNLFLFFALKQYTYLFFSLFLAASGATIYVGSGLSTVFGIQNLIPSSLPLAYLCLGLVGLFGALFSMSLLNIRNSNRTLYFLWLAVIALNILTTPILVYIARAGGFSTDDIEITLFISMVVVIVAQGTNIYTLVHYWRKSIIARYWFLGITVHTWVLASWSVLLNTSMDLAFEPYNLAQFWTLVDTILLSALIAYNFRTETISRIDAQKKSVESLRLAHDLERAKSNFVASVGHDLRGPVQAISHFTQSLRHTLPSASQESLKKIDENVATISDLLDSMVKMSRTEWQATNPTLEEVSLAQLLSELRTEFSTKVAEKNLTLQIDTTQTSVYTDRVCLSQILRNLIDNAIKYTHSGTVKVLMEEDVRSVRIIVEDSGQGIPENELSNIFNEFYKVPEGHADISGVGLGLSIVARLTRILGMKLSVSSRLHHGSRFDIKIEKVSPGDEAGATIPTEQLPGSFSAIDAPITGSLSGTSMLVISRNDPAVDLQVDLLKSWGGDVCHLHSIHDTIKYLDGSNSVPDLILTDSASYQVMDATLSVDEIEQLYIDDTPVLISVPDDKDFSQDSIERKNHTVISASVEPMRFRSLVQRSVAPHVMEM